MRNALQPFILSTYFAFSGQWIKAWNATPSSLPETESRISMSKITAI